MQKEAPTKELARLADRIFISAVVGQVILILIIFLIGLSGYAWSVDRDSDKKIQAKAEELLPSITEAVYVNSKTGSFELKDLPVLKDLESALKLNGVPAKARIHECGMSNEGEGEFKLMIGEFSLDHCLYIERSSRFALKGVLFGFALAIVSVLLSVLGWVLWRERFKNRILLPVVESLEREARDAAVGKMASQIAHDIRSPLAALNIFMKDLTGLPEEKRTLLRSAVNRIQDIANNILPSNRNRQITFQKSEPTVALSTQKVELLTHLIEGIVSEKRLQYREMQDLELITKFDQFSYGAFSSIQASEFQRVISNLIDNAIEALKDAKGRVVVLIETRPEEDRVKISIVDNGKGIPANILPKLMVKGASFNKQGGSGLGLSHARQTIEAWGGLILIESRENFGTKVAVSLKRSQPPKWFIPGIELELKKSIVILDDDPSIHQIWLGRFQSSFGKNGVTDILRFSSPEEADRYFHSASFDAAEVFLVDYEFMGSKENGLSWILKHQLMSKSVLVTSRFEENSIRSLCERMGLKLLPKSLSPYIPIHLKGESRENGREDTWARAAPL